MKPEIQKFGMYGKEESTVSLDFLNLVSIDSSCRKHNWLIKPHFHTNLYQFFFIESGSGICTFNDVTKSFMGVNLIIMPENNLHGFKFSEDIKGYTLSVSSHIIEKITQKDKELFYEINKVRFINMNNHFQEFDDAMDSLRRMIKDINLKGAKCTLFLETLLLLLLIKMYRFQIDSDKDFTNSTRELVYYKEFIKKIKHEIPTNKSIDDFAFSIGISKTHLNRVCQSVVGESTKQVINQYLIQESKILMLHTSLTISELAFQLDFKDVSYFCRFFKKQTGISPSKFREINFNLESVENKIALNY